MAHPYAGHKENAVGHRRVKTLMNSGGYVAKRANGGSVAMDEIPACPEPDADDMPMIEGRKSGGRLDKRARGGAVQKFALGGTIRKITPSKRKPHINININSGPKPPLAIKPMGLPGVPGMALGGKIGKMRTGKDAGQGSGEGRLEEYKRMKGK